MKKTIALFILGFSLSTFAGTDTRNLFKKEVTLKFEPNDDSLCFANHGFMSSAGKNPYLMTLAAIADREGSCQGMVGVAAAVKTKVVFRPDQPKMSKKQVARQVRRAVYLHQNNCEKSITIDGYQNLKELCYDHERALRRRSLQYNLTLAITKILPESRTFFFKKPLSTPKKAGKHILKELISFHDDLARGEFPLMLVRNHVTLVTGMTIERDDQGHVTRIRVHHYNPNWIMSSEREMDQKVYDFASREGESVYGQLIWNITPRRHKIRCLLTLK